MFVRNSWYVVAWGDEVTHEKPVGRTILGEPLVIFRTADGALAVLEGKCAHRRMALAHGKVDGDILVCPYHGLSYDAGGTCVRVPGQPKPPRKIKLRSYPAVERYGAVWAWMGDPAAADESRIFACERLAPDGSNGHKFYFHVKANYLYVNDNLSDLLHQAYLHNPSFGGNTFSLGETVPTVKSVGSGMSVRWDWNDVPVPGLFGEVGRIDGKADGWNHSTFVAPSFYINSVGFAKPGTGGPDSTCPQGNGKLSFAVHQLITPETERSTHFFKIVHCEWPQAVLPRLRNFIEDVNNEDVWACEEQQRMEDLDPKAPMGTIPTDRAVVAMRRIVSRLQQQESEAAE